jgi:hypothetical protein
MLLAWCGGCWVVCREGPRQQHWEVVLPLCCWFLVICRTVDQVPSWGLAIREEEKVDEGRDRGKERRQRRASGGRRKDASGTNELPKALKTPGRVLILSTLLSYSTPHHARNAEISDGGAKTADRA